MKINSNQLQIKGKVELSQPLNREKNYRVIIEGEITDVRTPDNHDGTFNQIFIYEPKTLDILSETDRLMSTKVKDKQKWSQTFRIRLMGVHRQDPTDIRDFEEVYNTIMKNLCNDESIEMLYKVYSK